MPKRKIDWYGPRLRELRETASLSQAELGKRVDLAGSQINKLETNVNQPTLATALAIAEALSVPITAFLPEGSTQAPSIPKKARNRLPKAAPATPRAGVPEDAARKQRSKKRT
jgi:transcriptional regulator with XRE-family HTH domain